MESHHRLYDQLMQEYNKSWCHSGISGERVARRLSQLAEIGWTTDGGCRRISFSEEELAAKKLVMKWMEEEDLIVHMDGAGNVFGKLEGIESLPVAMSGSHLDSVPNGGHFDGPLGVICALEVASAWRETGFRPKRSYEVVIFSDEEGARFNGGLLGSQSIVGEINIEEERKRVDFNGDSFEEVINRVGLKPEGFLSAKRDLSEIAAFVEVHIEQGKRLEKSGLPVGVVTGIAGPTWLQINFKGEAGHAGNTPMDDRKDALVTASEFISSVKDFPREVSPSGVATVGKLEVFPNGVNVIPGEVRLTVDIRDIKEGWKQEIVTKVKNSAYNIGERNGIEVDIQENINVSPVEVPQHMQQLAKEAVVEQLGVEPYFLPSGAGHDAMIIGRYVPMAILFTQSKKGISHNPKEWSSLNDCIATAHVLKSFIEKLCSK